VPTAITTTTATHRDTKSATVYVRTLWADDWVEVTHFYPDWLVWAVSPNMSSAGFSYDYGVGMRQAEATFATVAPQELRGKYVKVSIDQYLDGEETVTLDWYGRVREEDRDVHGTMLEDPAGGSARVPKARQTMLADGLEVLLHEAKVLTSWWLRDGVDTEVGRGLVFNGPHQVSEGAGPDPATRDEGTKNRSEDPGNKGKPIFAGNLEDAKSWSTRDIVKYLLAYHAPKDKDGGDAIVWRLGLLIWEMVLPNWDRPVIPTHGRTVRDLLNAAIDRRRLLGWRLAVVEGDEDDDPDILVVEPFTYLDEDLDLPSGNSMIANLNQKTLDFDEAVDMSRAEIKVTQAQQYDQVLARGDRILCCGTVCKWLSDENTPLLDQAWTDEQEAEYDEAASVNTGPGGVRDPNVDYMADNDVPKWQQRNNLVRAAEHLEPVYSHFRLDKDWAGFIADVATDQAIWELFPFKGAVADGVELANHQVPWYFPDLRWHRRLPLYMGYDYSGFEISDPEIKIVLPEKHKWEHRRTYVLIKVWDEDTENNEPARWVEAEKLATVVDTSDGLTLPDGAEPESYDFCCTVRVMDDAPGFVLRTSGKPQHYLAAADWDKLDEDYDVVILDWRTDMIVTFAMQADWYVEERFPADITDETDAVKLLTIDVPERARLEYVAQGTVVDTTNDGVLVYAKTGGFVRDDREWLKDLAKLAYEWYGEERWALTLTYDQAQTLWSGTSYIEPGDLIVEIGADESEQAIRTVVTEIRIDFAPEIEGDGPGQPHRTTVRTQWAELDPGAVV
jgi:hypothetical protein